MPANQTNILSTRSLPSALINKGAENNIRIDQVALISTEKIQTEETISKVLDLIEEKIVAVFTSNNAVDAVGEMLLRQSPEWQIFCTAGSTKTRVTEVFSKSNIVATAMDAAHLSEKIVESGYKNITFFCGTQRRNELPLTLREHKIALVEIPVYETITHSKKIESDYDGIMFFSPSAVEIFFSNNTTSNAAVLFAIGETTAASIKQYSSNKVITSSFPAKEALLDTVVYYFNTINRIS
jgi:uroporphyrinogen-III synthase